MSGNLCVNGVIKHYCLPHQAFWNCNPIDVLLQELKEDTWSQQFSTDEYSKKEYITKMKMAKKDLCFSQDKGQKWMVLISI